MQKANSSDRLLIIVELGGNWPNSLIARSAQRRVLAQSETEAPAAFAARVIDSLNDLPTAGGAFDTVLIACSERLDERARSARTDVARAAASALSRARGGDVVFFACDRNQGRSRAEFSVCAVKLGKEWRSSAVHVTLHFGDEAAELVSSAVLGGSEASRREANAAAPASGY